VEYSLTDYGDELETVLVAIQDWGKKHRERIIGKF
jgi:DNA-binding HxlR family transcriptional regulator